MDCAKVLNISLMKFEARCFMFVVISNIKDDIEIRTLFCPVTKKLIEHMEGDYLL